MRIAVCIDSRGGMLFNCRRQSQDRILRQNLLLEAAGGPLWMSPYSLEQFGHPLEQIRTAEDFPCRAGPGELCFFEELDPAPWLAEAEAVILYCWNRTYPADRRFPLPLMGWTVERREEFAGSSHERITKEVYRR